jgi:hypothetical protein
MRFAKVAELKKIYSHFQTRKDVFPHVRQDKLCRQIQAKQMYLRRGGHHHLPEV